MRTGKRFGDVGSNNMNGALRRLVASVVLPIGWAAVVAAPFVTHAALATGRFTGAATLLGALEVALLGTMAVRRLRGWRLAAGLCGVAVLLALLGTRLLRPGWAGAAGLIAASGSSHAFIYGSLLLLFGRSLLAGRTDLITGLATRLRGSLDPSMLTYTRTVTKAWCFFFALQLVTSVMLLALAPHRVWSLFVNVLDGPSVVVMFAGEYAIRRWRFRGYRHISPVETVRTFARSRAAGS